MPPEPSDITIRPAIPADLAAIQRLNTDLFAYEHDHGFYVDDSFDLDWPLSPAGTAYFTEFLSPDNPSRVAFIAEQTAELTAEVPATTPAARPIGYLAAAYYDRPYRRPHRIAHLENIFVEADLRRQGVGARLVSAFKAWARESQAARLRVEAFAPNHPALAFYRRQGFSDLEIVLEQSLGS